MQEKAMQIPVPNNPPVLSKNTSLPIPMHMYSRRKKGKNAGMVKDAHNIHRNEKPCAVDGQERPAITCNSGVLPERSKPKGLHHAQKVEKVSSHGEQESHAHAACGTLNNEKPKKVYSRRKAKDAPFKDKERHKEQKVAKAKCALSPDKKLGPDTKGECALGQYEAKEQKLAKAKCALSPDTKRDRTTEEECALGPYEAIVGQFLKTSDSSELGVVAAVVEGGKSAAVRAGLQASTSIPIEKAWFKDVLKQPDGLRTYLECRNFILGLWEKDVCRTLSITDYGLSAAASSNETSRIRLFRDIHYFLSYRGFINLGVTSKKPRQSPEIGGGAIPSNLGEAKSVRGFARADGHSEMEAITYVQDSAGPANVKQPELPKIMSFQKFAKRDHIDVSKRRPLQRETLLLYGKDLVTSGADARHSKVRDWSIDFSDSCSYLGSPRLLAMLDNASSRDGFSAVLPSVPGISSTEIAGERHESGVTSNQDDVALPTSKEATDDASAGSSMRDSQRRQSGVCLASLNSGNTPLNTAPSNEDDKLAELLSPNVDAQKLEGSISNHPSADADKRDSQSHSTEKRPDSAEGRCCSLNEANAASAGSSVRLAAGKQIEAQHTMDGSPGQLLPDGGKSYLSTGGLSKSMMLENPNPKSDMSEQVKKAVMDYVAHLLTPLYKTRRISKESFKSIMKKSIAKVMERRTEEELVMDAAEFMDTKRKIKIRSLVDKLVERYLESVHKQ